MGLYLVTERLVERCNYYHLVEAENEEEACKKVDTGESSVVGSDFVGWVGVGKITEVERVDGQETGTIAHKIALVSDSLCRLCPQCWGGECHAFQAPQSAEEERQRQGEPLCQLIRSRKGQARKTCLPAKG